MNVLPNNSQDPLRQSRGGKGILMQKDKSATLSTMCDQVLFAPVLKNKNGGGSTGVLFVSYEHHGHDSRVRENKDGRVQTITSNMTNDSLNGGIILEIKNPDGGGMQPVSVRSIPPKREA